MIGQPPGQCNPQSTPFWRRWPALPGSAWRDRCEVAVIGGGISGVATALALSGRGVDVALLEATRVGGGATGRSAGQVNPIGPPALFALPASEVAALYRMWRDNLSRLRARVERHAVDCDLQSSPLLMLARRRSELDRLLAALPRYVDQGCDVSALEADALGSWAAPGQLHGGLRFVDHARCDPLRLVRGLAAAAVADGARLHEQTPVMHLTSASDGALTLATPRGPLSAELVVHATGWAATRLAPALAEALFPVRAQMSWTAPATGTLAASCSANAGYDYWHQAPGGELLVGGMRYLEAEMECGLTEDAVNPRIAAGQRRLVDGPLGPLGAPPTAGQWSGIMTFTGDELPLVGGLPGRPRELLLGGWCGHGLAGAVAAGEALAARIAGEDVAFPWALLDPRRLTV